MLKRLAMFGILALCLVDGAGSQVPRDRGQQDRPSDKKADSAQPTRPLPPAAQIQLAPAKQEGNSQQKPSKYPWRELYAPANVPNWILAFVAGWAGFLAYRTLKAIKRQADLMKEQSDLAKSKERARLRVEMGDVILRPKADFFLGFGADWIVKIYGPTEAFIVASQCHSWVGDKERYERPRDPDPTGMPDVISPASKPLQLFVNLRNSDNSDDVSADERIAIERGEKVIYCTGCIIFKNVFDETWMLDFAQRYIVSVLPEGATFGMWSRNQNDANGESQIFPIKSRKRRWFGLLPPVPPATSNPN